MRFLRLAAPFLRLTWMATKSLFFRSRAYCWKKREFFAVALLFLAVTGFYYWTAESANYTSIREVRGIVFTKTSPEYYPLLTEGFLHGQLNLLTDPSPELLRLSDPWDPVKAGKLRLPDVTFFKGKFYLYFGPSPVLLFFLPAKLITGYYPSHSFAAFFFCAAGYGASLLCFNSIRRRYFLQLGLKWLILGGLVLGYAGAVPQMLRRPDVWEVAIACGYFTLSGAIGFRPRRGKPPDPSLRLVGDRRTALLFFLGSTLTVGLENRLAGGCRRSAAVLQLCRRNALV
jgi:hypothetical protein